MKKIIKTISICLSVLCIFTLISCMANKNNQDDKPKVGSILILGNSIVAHDPAPSIGWNGDWGMAASGRDKDFVHIIEREVHKTNPEVKVTWGNLAEFEREYESYDLSKLDKYGKADMIIVKISENVQNKENMEEPFLKAFEGLIGHLKNENSVVIVSEGFWPTPVNGYLKKYAQSNNYPFVKLADLFENDKTNAAIGLFENEGVANHPSDKGMQNIASRLLEVIAKYDLK